MGEKKVRFEEKKKHSKESELTKDTHSVVQIFEIIFVSLILFLVFTSEFQLLNVHVFHSTVWWVLMMVQGLLVFRGISPLFKRILGSDKVFIHWVLETIALIGATLGFCCAYASKNENNKEHFVTWHALCGLSGFTLVILSGLNGIPTLYRKELKNYFSPKWMKFVHILTGTLGFLLGGCSLILACYTNWFAKRTSKSPVTFGIAIVLIVSVVIWTLVRPIEKVRNNWKKLISTT